MSTVIDKSLLERKISDIDFNSLDPFQELRKINPKFMETYDVLKGLDKINWLKSYNVGDPIEEELIQYALDKMMPEKLSSTEESKVRRAMAEEASKGIEIDSPEKEAEWEQKIQEARMKDKGRMDQIRDDRKIQYSGDPNVSLGEGLEAVKGLGSKSIEKLHQAGVKTLAEFESLSKDQLVEMVGHVVASKFVRE